VEHRVSHQGDLALKYNWNNLFLSCSHCHNTKRDKYDNIINPTIVDPEEYIAFSIDGLRKNVTITKLDGGTDVDITIELLDRVYNGTTDIKRFEANALRNRLSDELALFKMQAKLYDEEPTTERFDYIKREISRASLFAAFKRKIVRDSPMLANTFSGVLTWN
jgi:uncharacterized membrane-anchored protein YjiN (DUF445 family)